MPIVYMIKYRLNPDGSFVVGDTETGFTNYAFPETIWAKKAKQDPSRMANLMAKACQADAAWLREDGEPYAEEIREYDNRNWVMLNAPDKA